MQLELYWKAHPTSKDTIIGIGKELPDNFCHFYIMRLTPERFWVSIPSLSADYLTKRLIFRDAQTARHFCIDYLNYNAKSIIEYQLSEMKRRSTNSIKSITYYEAFLESRVMRKPDPAPKRPFRKAG